MQTAKLKNAGTFLLILLLYIVFMKLTGIGCPIRWFTGIPCPGCGMTRALFALLHLDFFGAFSCHPMIYPLLIFLPWYFLAEHTTPRKKRIKNFILTVMIILAISVWIFRIFHEDSIVYIDLSDSVMIKCLKSIRGFLGKYWFVF